MPRKTQAENKTQPTALDPRDYLATIEHAGRREDAFELLDLMTKLVGEPAKMWGPSIIGFGKYHYVYESGREGDHFLCGFAPRKANLVVYIMPGFSLYTALLGKLGKHKTGSSCLYLGRLETIDRDVLSELVKQSVTYMRSKYDVPS